MQSKKEMVLEVLDQPRTHVEIARQTGLPRNVVRTEIKGLRKEGYVISRGATAAVRNMSIPTAIEDLYSEIDAMKRQIKAIEARLE